MKPTRHRLLLGLALLPLAACLTACGGSAGDSSADTASRSTAAEKPAANGGAAQDSLSTGAPGAEAAVARSVITRSVIATGELRLTTAKLDGARQDAINLATGLHGFVADEQSQSDSHGALDRVDLTLRVPATSFEKALDGLAALGTLRHRTQSVEDVSTQVIDTAARVRAQKASVASIQQLLARATTIAEIISIEGQLATRQADLDSLEQQQRYLEDQTSLSTIQLTLTHPAKQAPHKAHHKATGFLAGLDGGWHALAGTAVVLGTVLGALLPFAVVLALVGGPAWLITRRRRLSAPPPAPEE